MATLEMMRTRILDIFKGGGSAKGFAAGMNVAWARQNSQVFLTCPPGVMSLTAMEKTWGLNSFGGGVKSLVLECDICDVP